MVRSSDDRRQRARATAVSVAAAHGIDATGAVVERTGTTVMVRLTEAGVLARLFDRSDAAVAAREVQVADVLARARVPAARLAGIAPDAQPIETEDFAVTFWRYTPHDRASPVTPSDLGSLVRHLHDATRALAGDLARCDPFAAVRAQLDRSAEAGGTAPDDLARLRDAAVGLAEAWRTQSEEDPLGATLVHGDLHAGNVLATSSGPMLVDLELAGLGPATYDLAPQLVAVRRYGAAPAGFEEFSSAYGFDLRDWEGATLMCSVQELWVTAWAVGNRHHSETIDREAEVRLEVWRGATDPPRWQLR